MSSFIETSVLTCYITLDPPEAAFKARRLIEDDGPLLLTTVVLVETEHVLRKIYGLSRHQVIDLLIDFIQRENVAVHHFDKPIVITALLLCRPSGRVTLPDALIWAEARTVPNSVVYSFDQRFPNEGIEYANRTNILST